MKKDNSLTSLAKSLGQWQQENLQDNVDFRTNTGIALPPSVCFRAVRIGASNGGGENACRAGFVPEA
jgi:hypothetical protein